MRTVGLRELRQNASTVIKAAEAGETIKVTVQGREAALITPIDRHEPRADSLPGWVFWERSHGMPPVDPNFAADLNAMRDNDPLEDPWERRRS